MEGTARAPGSITGRIDGERLWNRLMEMARIGAIPGDGVNRQALSEEDIAARALLIEWGQARGFSVTVDEVANLFIRREGTDPNRAPVLVGSHMDSQPRGGRFDGIYGVMAGFEVLETLEDLGAETRRPVELVAWTNEEGSRFDPGCMGSLVFSGGVAPDAFNTVTDGDGTPFGDALAATISAAPEAARRGDQPPPAAYLEAHIEQGPILESMGTPIGAVTGVQGSRRFIVEITGDAAHAGTTPVRARRDAVQAALRVIGRMNEIAEDPQDVLRFTIGRFDVSPNSPNTVPAEVSFSIDLRHPDEAVLESTGEALMAACAEPASPCAARIRQTFAQSPAVFDEDIVSLVDALARALEMPVYRMPSGAFHDASFISGVCPTGMIFIPCRDGVSHHESEYASPEDCASGARVLAAVLQTLANR